jgi:methyl-accepting chemotaxis protein
VETADRGAQGRIEPIQSDTRSAVEAIGRVSAIIKRITDIRDTIAIAVDEQNQTTTEISRGVSEAARGSGEIVRNIKGVAEGAARTANAASAAQIAAGELATMAAGVQAVIARFDERDTLPANEASERTAALDPGASRRRAASRRSA